MSFPADINGCMKDCILSLFWPRKGIVGFFEKHGCTKAEIAPLQLEGENALKRPEVVDALFAALAVRSDQGLGPLRAMLRGLFISVNGFSPEVIRSLVMGKDIQTLFIDGEDLILVLEGHLNLREMIDRKVKAAQTRGLIYIHPISGIEKKF